ncbi:MAG: RNase adapter RapZ [Candidatus Geothermincolia bacterium]
MEVIIITGLSGAGKSVAIKSFEDIGYFCVDNLPPSLVTRMAELSSMPGTEIDRLVLVIDARGGVFFDELAVALRELGDRGFSYRILFLEANDEQLLRRYKETRRAHPLARGGDILDGIRAERQVLSTLKEKADLIIDTTELTGAELRARIGEFFRQGAPEERLTISVLSFGYKFGVPLDSDIIFDVRFLPNPYWVETLRELTGNDADVCDYVMAMPETGEFMERFKALIDYVIPCYVNEGKSYLTIALGCTGGRHRSVVLAEELARHLRERGFTPSVKHRDVEKA